MERVSRGRQMLVDQGVVGQGRAVGARALEVDADLVLVDMVEESAVVDLKVYSSSRIGIDAPSVGSYVSKRSASVGGVVDQVGYGWDGADGWESCLHVLAQLRD